MITLFMSERDIVLLLFLFSSTGGLAHVLPMFTAYALWKIYPSI